MPPYATQTAHDERRAELHRLKEHEPQDEPRDADLEHERGYQWGDGDETSTGNRGDWV